MGSPVNSVGGARWRDSAAALLSLLLTACGAPPDPQLEVTGPTMGTYYAVKVARPPAGLDTEALRAGVERVLADVIDAISTYAPDSELSRLNRNPSTDWIPVSPQLYAVIVTAQHLSALSDGAFDCTVGPLVNLWGFGPEAHEGVPAPEAIAAARARVGYHLLELRPEPPAVRKARGDLYIDLSALGEGEGADRMAAWLDSVGATDYMAAVAGTLRVRGKNAKGQPWGIAVEEPTPVEQVMRRILPVTDRAVSTSGDYRNFFESGGQRYSHHIDPKTGRPVAQSLASVTVVRPDGPDSARTTDGLATTLIVMGEERARTLAESEGISAYFILHEGTGLRDWQSSTFKGLGAP